MHVAGHHINTPHGTDGEHSVSWRSRPITITDGPGRICVQEMMLRPGLWLSILDIRPDKALSFRYQRENAYVGFGFVLAGDMCTRVSSASSAAMDLEHRAGLSGIQFMPESEGVVALPAQKRMMILHVHMAPHLLHDLLREELHVLSRDFRRIVEGAAHRDYLCQGKMAPAVWTVAHQIMHDHCHGMPRRLFLEGKALELIARQISWLVAGTNSSAPVSTISPGERERVRAACEMLVCNVVSPPTLAELSLRFSVSINKLESGCRELFGTTVYGFLKEHRMQQARRLFEEADMNVSQVAWQVGYINVSHFGAAFKKRFGIAPKTYLKTVRGSRLTV